MCYCAEIAHVLSQRTGKLFTENDVSIALKEANYTLNKVHNRNPAADSIAQVHMNKALCHQASQLISMCSWMR